MTWQERLVVVKKLFELGYFVGKTWPQVVAAVQNDAVLSEVVRKFREFHGLDTTSTDIDDDVLRRLKRPRCAMPDFMTAEATCKWPNPKVTWFQQLRLRNMPTEHVQQAFEVAYTQWAAVCGIQPNQAPASNQANIFSRSGTGRANQLDGAGGTLAWSELPCGVSTNAQLAQMYDEGESWTFDMLVAVACHEIGHALGLPHLQDGNLMAPYYDPRITKPQAGDIAEMVKRYGQPTAPPAPPTTPPTPTGKLDVDVLVRINGKLFRADNLAPAT